MIFDPDSHYPSRVFDADGNEILWAHSGDTETGVCKLVVRGENGRAHLGPDNEPVLATATFKAPLRLQPIEVVVYGSDR